jgi:hypothetical protein
VTLRYEPTAPQTFLPEADGRPVDAVVSAEDSTE